MFVRRGRLDRSPSFFHIGTINSKISFIFVPMSYILHIETSTTVCSVALSYENELMAEAIDTEGQNHIKLLTLLIEKILAEARFDIGLLNAVAISQGPGSYTGLRIGTSVAKGICYAQEIPLIAVNTLQVLANQPHLATPLCCPMIDARRMEVYCQLFDDKIEAISDVEAKILDEYSFKERLEKEKITFLGDGAEKFQAICKYPNAVFQKGIYPEAKQMISLAKKAFDTKKYVDVAYFTPFYLKKFQVTQSKKQFF